MERRLLVEGDTADNVRHHHFITYFDVLLIANLHRLVRNEL